MRKYFEINKNENITYQNLWDALKAMLREKFTALMYMLEKKKLYVVKKNNNQE